MLFKSSSSSIFSWWRWCATVVCTGFRALTAITLEEIVFVFIDSGDSTCLCSFLVGVWDLVVCGLAVDGETDFFDLCCWFFFSDSLKSSLNSSC